MEGHAPSAELAAPMAALSKEFTAVHGGPQSLNVALNDDTRGVFHRLFAAPEEFGRPASGAEKWIHLARFPLAPAIGADTSNAQV